MGWCIGREGTRLGANQNGKGNDILCVCLAYEVEICMKDGMVYFMARVSGGIGPRISGHQ
jgi:hypothetical protein